MDGFDLVIIDSLRAAAPSADENSSEVRKYIDRLGRATAKTGAVCIFIHHARKPKADDPDGAKFKIRGSSALFDACASVFVFEAAKGQPTRVHHEKCRNRGTLIQDIGLAIEDVEVDGDARGGLRVRHLEPEQLAAVEGQRGAHHSKAMRRIVEFLRGQQDREFRGAKGSLLASIGMGRSAGFAALEQLQSTGTILVDADHTGKVVRLLRDEEAPCEE